MQRLFSSFPSAWPGAGLLLLRLIGAGPVVVGGITALLSQSASPAPWLHIIGAAGGSLLLMGFWTPFGGALQALAQGGLAFWNGDVDAAALICAGIAASLVMLGPGAWSVDARLYGRKRIEF